MAPSHRSGPLKQQNKKHKIEKKRTGVSGIKKCPTSAKHKLQSKRERRLAAKQRRKHKVSELKKYLVHRGSQSNPILCVIAPLTDAVPAHLAQLLLRNCDPDAVDLQDQNSSLQQTAYFRSPLLGKHLSLVTTRADDLFGCLDLIQLADWLILVVPSDCSNLDESADRFLSALYAQGLVNTSFAVLSSTCNLKELRDSVQTKFTIPEGVVHPLNNTSQALSLLRHICSSHVLSSSGKLSKTPGSMSTMCAHSSARFRAGILADSISLSALSDNQFNSDLNYLRVSGQVKGSPLFLFESLNQTKSQQPVRPVLYLPGWGDYPLARATWCDPSLGMQCWSPESCLPNSPSDCQNPLDMIENIPDLSDDSDLSDSPSEMTQDSEGEDATTSADLSTTGKRCDSDLKAPGNQFKSPLPMDTDEQENRENSGEDNDDSGLDDAMTSYAARTVASSCGSVFSQAQLTKFRAARLEELFPDEVETPPNIPARDRFMKYRCLPRFHGSKWPVERDQLPEQYENIACFKSYHRNRRSIIRYLQQRISNSLKEQQATILKEAHSPQYIPAGVRVELLIGPFSSTMASEIAKYHTQIQPNSTSKRPPPLVVWSLLPHESRLSVCHFAMHRVTSALHAASDLAVVAAAANKAAEDAEKNAWADNNVDLNLGEEACSHLEEGSEEIRRALSEHQSQTASVRKTRIDPNNPVLVPEVEPIKSKELMLFQVGIRRFISAPIYSTLTASPNEKAKFETFFSTSQNDTIASVYAPVMYSPANVLQFRVRVDEDEHGDIGAPYVAELVATGSLHSVDPSRLIIKRIFLSGHPYKIRQRQAVVRFMFFNPVDVEFFKTVPLQTKLGAAGHIKEPVGTHGLMKCVFDRPINAADVVLMPLYKRVFPKYVYQPHIAKFNQLVPTRRLLQCYVSHETIQLRAKGASHSNDVQEEAMSIFE